VTLGRSNSFRLPAYKEVNACQWSDARLHVQMKCRRVWWDQAIVRESFSQNSPWCEAEESCITLRGFILQ